MAVDPISIGVAAGSALPGLINTIFGTTTPVGQVQQTTFRPEDMQRLQQALGGLQTGQSNLLQQLSNIGIPQTGFGGGLDAFSRALISQGQQRLNQQAGTQAAGIQRQLGGINPTLAAALARSGALQTQLQGNALPFQAAQEQVQRQQAEQQLGLQAAQLRGQTALQGFQAQQFLPELLFRLAQSQAPTQTQQQFSRVGGILGGGPNIKAPNLGTVGNALAAPFIPLPFRS